MLMPVQIKRNINMIGRIVASKTEASQNDGFSTAELLMQEIQNSVLEVLNCTRFGN